MGYRPEFKDMENPDLCFYGTKLYGYTDESALSSFQYLLSIRKVERDTIWDYGSPNEMTLTAEQFRKFMQLYEKDFDERSEYLNLCEYHDYNIIRALMQTESDKHIEWN